MIAHSHLLVVEGDPSTRRLLASLLLQMGYNVTSAATGEEALSVLYSEEWCDAVLTDTLLPGISGLELAARVHAVRADVPVVFVAGRARECPPAADPDGVAPAVPITRERLAAVLHDALDSPRRSEARYWIDATN
jgi:CheY-like chemotaxis protein